MKTLFNTGFESGATFSDCRTWRYLLWRGWNPYGKTVAFVGLNPSTADETKNDPTMRRCIDFCQRMKIDNKDVGCFIMLNLFAYRSTDPQGLRECADPIGSENDRYISETVHRVDRVVVAWGAHSTPFMQERIATVAAMITNPMCLGTTKSGQPKHPLYVPAKTQLVPWGMP